jgi:hypothetical protein
MARMPAPLLDLSIRTLMIATFGMEPALNWMPSYVESTVSVPRGGHARDRGCRREQRDGAELLLRPGEAYRGR